MRLSILLLFTILSINSTIDSIYKRACIYCTYRILTRITSFESAAAAQSSFSLDLGQVWILFKYSPLAVHLVYSIGCLFACTFSSSDISLPSCPCSCLSVFLFVCVIVCLPACVLVFVHRNNDCTLSYIWS